MNNDYLIHYGVSGQKWGIRKYQYEDGTLTPAGKARYYKDTKTNKFKKMKSEYMSDRELKYANERLGNEERYNQLTSRKPIKKSLINGGIAATVVALGTFGTKAVGALYENSNWPHPAAYVNWGKIAVESALAGFGSGVAAATTSLGIQKIKTSGKG